MCKENGYWSLITLGLVFMAVYFLLGPVRPKYKAGDCVVQVDDFNEAFFIHHISKVGKSLYRYKEYSINRKTLVGDGQEVLSFDDIEKNSSKVDCPKWLLGEK